MNNSPKHPQDNFEEPMMTAFAMVRAGKVEEACLFLAEKRDLAISEGARDDASLYASVRGSYLVVAGRDQDALEAYLEAERLADGRPSSVFYTALHLLSGMKQPDKALEKADVILASEDISDAMRLQAHAIRGLAFLDLNQPEEASEELLTLFSGLEQLPARSCDLMLVEEFSQRGLRPELCRRYLDVVESKARAEGENRTLKRIRKARKLLP